MDAFHNIKVRSLIFWMLGTGFVILILSVIFIEEGASSQDISYEMLLIDFGILVVFPMIWVIYQFKKNGVKVSEYINFHPQSFEWKLTLQSVAMLIILAFGTVWLLYNLLFLLSPSLVDSFFGDTEIGFVAFDGTTQSIINNLSIIILAVVFAPIIEEILFRGILLHRWTVKWGVKTAVIISSLIFGILHVDIIGAFIFGVIMCILYIKSRSLLVPIVCHMIYNGIVTFVSLIDLQFFDTVVDQSVVDTLYGFSWLYILFLILSLSWAIYVIRRHWKLVRNENVPYLMNTPTSSRDMSHSDTYKCIIGL